MSRTLRYRPLALCFGYEPLILLLLHDPALVLASVPAQGHTLQARGCLEPYCCDRLQTAQESPTIAGSSASWVHTVKLVLLYCRFTVLVNALLVWLLSWPILCKLFSLQL